MGDTSRKPNPLFVPGVLLAALLVASAYNLHVANDGRLLRRELSSMQVRIQEKREILGSLERLDRERETMRAFSPTSWVPILTNHLEARLQAEGRVMSALQEAKAQQPNLEWKEEAATGLRRATLTLKALFPSYMGFVQCLRALEEGVPPLLPQSLEMKKEGMRIRISLTLGFHYRLAHEGS
jgi:hypothetical protein